jgi:hypothetical protein
MMVLVLPSFASHSTANNKVEMYRVPVVTKEHYEGNVF